MKFRLILQPLMAIIFAVRSGLKDAKEGRPALFLGPLYPTRPPARHVTRRMEGGGQSLRHRGHYRLGLSVDCLQVVLSRRGTPCRRDPGSYPVSVDPRSGESDSAVQVIRKRDAWRPEPDEKFEQLGRQIAVVSLYGCCHSEGRFWTFCFIGQHL